MPLSYETLDRIADAYIPLLLVCFFIFAVSALTSSKTCWRKARNLLIVCVVMLIWIYGMYFLDQQWLIWHRLGLDYSTHTAVAAALCAQLWHLSSPANPCRPIWPLSLLIYCVLMHYQQYHTWSDMLLTLLYMGIGIWLLQQLRISEKRNR